MSNMLKIKEKKLRSYSTTYWGKENCSWKYSLGSQDTSILTQKSSKIIKSHTANDYQRIGETLILDLPSPEAFVNNKAVLCNPTTAFYYIHYRTGTD